MEEEDGGTSADVIEDVILTDKIIYEADKKVMSIMWKYNYAEFNNLINKLVRLNAGDMKDWIGVHKDIVESYADWDTLSSLFSGGILSADTENTTPEKYGFFHSVFTLADYRTCLQLIGASKKTDLVNVFVENELKMVRMRLWDSWDAVPEFVAYRDQWKKDDEPEIKVTVAQKKKLDEIFGNDDFEKSNGRFHDQEQLEAVLGSGVDEMLSVDQTRRLLKNSPPAKNIFELQALADLLMELDRDKGRDHNLYAEKVVLPAKSLIHTLYKDSPRLINRVFDIVNTSSITYASLERLFDSAWDPLLSNLSPSNAAKLPFYLTQAWISKYFGRLRTVDNFKNRVMDAEAWPAEKIVPYLRRISTLPYFEQGVWKYLIDFPDDNAVHHKLMGLFNQAHPTLGLLFYIPPDSLDELLTDPLYPFKLMAANLPDSPTFDPQTTEHYDKLFLDTYLYFAKLGRNSSLMVDSSYVNEWIASRKALEGFTIPNPIDWKLEKVARTMLGNPETPEVDMIAQIRLINEL